MIPLIVKRLIYNRLQNVQISDVGDVHKSKILIEF